MEKLLEKKTEQLNYLRFIIHSSVVNAVNSYISFYNYNKLHSVINNKTPHQKLKK